MNQGGNTKNEGGLLLTFLPFGDGIRNHRLGLNFRIRWNVGRCTISFTLHG